MNDASRAAPLLPLWRVERILLDEGGLLVVDKPIGIPVHGGDERLCHDVVGRLGWWLRSQGRPGYLGVHQRLDQDTSGVLILVTDETKNAELASAIEGRELKRVYRAVVSCAPSVGQKDQPALADSAEVELSLRFDGRRAIVRGQPGAGGDARKASTKGATGFQRAVTRYSVLKRWEDRALIELSLITGRTHQIRATMAHLGYPVVGDRLYGGAPAARLMLHAVALRGGPLPRAIESPPPAIFSKALEGVEHPAEDLDALIRDAATLRAPLLAQTETFRLINGPGDGLPGLSADVYGPYVALNYYEATLLSKSVEIRQTLLSLGYLGIHEKRRVKADLRTQDAEQLAPSEAQAGDSAPKSLVVEENGMKIAVDLRHGLSSGLFVDMRDNRFKARVWARGGKVLNLFCYTSSFSVSAALAGAKTTNIDLSGRALECSRENFALNGLDPAQHRFFKEDAMKFLARSVRRGDSYDFIVLDPPSFATVGKGTFSVKSKYGQAVLDCLRLLGPGGRLLCVTNHTKTTPRALRMTVESAAQAAGRSIRLLRSLPSPLDCPPDAFGPWPSKSLLVEVEG